MRKSLFLLFGLAALIAAWLLADVRNRLSLFQPNGFIQSGSLLGAKIGDTRSSALVKLRGKGLVLQGTTNGGTCFFRSVEPGRQLDVFHVKSWHGGTICVVSRDDRVEELIWAFQPVSL